MSLTEVQAAMLVMAILSIPVLTMANGIMREAGLSNAESTVQWDLDQSLWRITRKLREATALANMASSSVRVRNSRNITRDIYLQDGSVWEKIGSNPAYPLAGGVSDLQFTYFRTVSGVRAATVDPTRVTEMGVQMTLSNGGFTRTGTLYVSLRNRPR
jgi:hypothetical protein